MVRFKLARSIFRGGGLTSKERRELKRLERRAEHDRDREERLRAREMEEKLREQRAGQEHGHGRPHRSGGWLFWLIIIGVLVYLYLKYVRQ